MRSHRRPHRGTTADADAACTSAAWMMAVGPPILVVDDDPALRRALGNLLDNAPRYASDGPIELACETQGASWRIGVLDRGPGILLEHLAAMFAPFQWHDASHSPQSGGAGRGLAIVRELAKANGWSVRLASREAGGLATWVEIPVRG